MKLKKNIALVVGINDYEHYPLLHSAVQDAESIGKVLADLKFEVEFCLDESKEVTEKYIERFEEKIAESKYDTALFFFAGHGCIANKCDCLLLKEAPTTNINNEVAVRNKSIVLENLCQRLRGAGDQTNIIIVDACRTETTRSAATNFEFGKNLNIPYQTFIAYSTSPGCPAKDGKSHSPYTQSLLNHISEENLPIETLFKTVRREVYESAGQMPWEHSCLVENFTFNYGQTSPFYELPYSREALADSNYIADSETAQDIISLFKEYNYYKQEEALSLLKLKHKSLSVNDKFVIGRNIFQSAVGGCYKCIEELCYTKLSIYQSGNLNPILDGIFYEMYFNSKGEFREENTKGGSLIDTIHLVSSYPLFKPSCQFIQKALTPYKQMIEYLPGDKATHSLSVTIIRSEKENPFGGSVWEIEKASTLNRDITALLSSNWRNGDKRKFITFISNLLCIPQQSLRVSFSNKVCEDDIIVSGIMLDDIFL